MAVLLLVVVVNEAPVVQSGNLSGFIVKLYQPFDHYFVLQLFRTRIITVADVKSDRAMSNRFFGNNVERQQSRTNEQLKDDVDWEAIHDA